MTGQYISDLFDAKKTYKGFLSTNKKNTLFREALILSIEDVYKNLQTQSNYDAILKVIKTNQIFSVNNNRIYCAPLDIINITHPSDFSLTTALPHNMKVGDSFTIANVAGFTTTVNGVQVVTLITNDFTFQFAATFTGGTYAANTGQITTHSLSGISKIITDYNHLLAVKTKYIRNVNVKVTKITNTTPITYTIDKRNNNIKTGELLTISGVLNNTNANGNFYVKKVNPIKFEVYYDKDLTIPVAGNGTASGSAVIERASYKYAVPLFSQNKVSDYEVATILKPMFERGNNQLIFYPLEYSCAEVTMDYIGNTTVFIDCIDTKIDLLDSYSEDFLYSVINRSVQLFADRFSDQGLQQNSLLEQQQSKS